MNVIIGGRQTGKTSQLVENFLLNSKESDVLLVATESMKADLLRVLGEWFERAEVIFSEDMRVDYARRMLTPEELEHAPASASIFVDEVEALLITLLNRPIATVTINVGGMAG